MNSVHNAIFKLFPIKAKQLIKNKTVSLTLVQHFLLISKLLNSNTKHEMFLNTGMLTFIEQEGQVFFGDDVSGYFYEYSNEQVTWNPLYTVDLIS